MSRTWSTWLIFGVCCAVVCGVMVWLSSTLLDLESTNRRITRQEDYIRLALWRMDFALQKFIATETARPPQEYETYYWSIDDPTCDLARQLSPIVTEPHPWVHFYFQVDDKASLTSPLMPNPAQRQELSHVPAIDEAFAMRQQFAAIIDIGDLASVCRPPPQIDLPPASAELRRRGSLEYMIRQHAVSQNVQEPMQPTWQANELLLTRVVSIGGRLHSQGCWLNWPAIEADLLALVEDLLPGARLEPVEGPAEVDPSRFLAGLPVRLEPGPMPQDPAEGMTPYQASLWIAWGGLAIAALTIAALLRGTIGLSERRAAFVSAVTHELRTPLTTFRMYTEMLVGNVITDPEKRQRYLTTLHGEAARLARLVENVLAYARLDCQRDSRPRATIRMIELLDRSNPRLRERAILAGMELVVTPPDDQRLDVHTDAEAMEQILFNLVDNACKYAAAAADRRIHLDVCGERDHALLRVRDHGPGLSSRARQRLFQPFSKSETDAANSAPGVGLGLSLCRRLARELGGDLTLEASHTGGASFLLRLPRGA